MDEASVEHLYLNNNNAAVELSPAATENLRIDGGSVDDHLHISSTSAEEKEDCDDIFVCTFCHSKHSSSSRCVDRRYPFLTNDPRDPPYPTWLGHPSEKLQSIFHLLNIHLVMST